MTDTHYLLPVSMLDRMFVTFLVWRLSVGANGVSVAIASCHDKINFGSALQSYATQLYLESRGFDVRTIDKTGLSKVIKPGRMNYYRHHVLDFQMCWEKAPFVGHRMRQRIIPEFGRKMSQRCSVFDRFAREHFRFTRKTFTFDELYSMSSEYDAVVVGSDQLWLPVNIAGGYFSLDWVSSSTRKISYATSVGLAHLDDFYLDRMSEFLSDYHAVSVREDSAAMLVERATGKRPAVTCDPTMLLTVSQWQAVANEDYVGIPKDPYLLCYFMGNNPWQRECAVRYARERNLKIVAVSQMDAYIASDDGYADYYPWDAGPAEWLALVEHADFVFTDSFHGTVFSSLFKVPFRSFRRHAATSGQSTNSRIDTLLNVLGLADCLCESFEAFDVESVEAIDFTSSQFRLEAYRTKSAQWLDASLAFEDCEVSSHVNIRHAEDCCGCAACVNICPENCIRMEFDVEGCEYPEVHEDVCIECGMCLKVCPITNVESDIFRPQRAFLVQNIDNTVLRQSTSGGAFTAFATTVIEMGGIVFGAGFDRDGEAIYDSSLCVRCMSVEHVEDLRFFRNSKYIQSEIGEAFRQVESFLDAGRYVLFSGTPCQCEGLYGYLGKKTPPNLSMVDFVCRAVPCRAVFEAYLDWLEGFTGIRLRTVLFRDKGRWGYEYSNMRAFEEDEPYRPADSANQVPCAYSAGVESDPYLRAFFADLSDRPSCYRCHFKKRYRVTDITMWDCFDAWRYDDSFDDNRGATRILVHSDKGLNLLEASLGMLRTKELDPDEAASRSLELVQSIEQNPKRMAMFSDLENMQSREFIAKWFPQDAGVVLKRAGREVLERTGMYSRVKRALCIIREKTK